MTRVLDAIARDRGYPKTLFFDNGPELTSLAVLAWAAQHHVRLAFIESFNGRFRDARRHHSKRIRKRHFLPKTVLSRGITPGAASN